MCSTEQSTNRTQSLQVQPQLSFFPSHFLSKESFSLTYMAVEQAAFVTCNSFRLLEVFNRHFKLKKEEACKTEKKKNRVDTEGGGSQIVRERKEKGRGQK